MKLPGWEMRAEAVLANSSQLVSLDKTETQLAYLAQDDRIAPVDNEDLFDDEGKPVPLRQVPCRCPFRRES